MVQVKIEKLKYLWANNKQTIIIIASALVLTIALLAVRAASPFASFEAEGANLAGNASVKSASGTSGGNYVEFGSGASGTSVSIQGKSFYINGQLANQGAQAEGLLTNLRTVQAAFHDENSSNVQRFAYPDTNQWDPERNVNEFLSFIPTMASKGLNAVTIGMQGGNPYPGGAGTVSHPERVSAFRGDGTIKDAWKSRLERIIDKLDQNEMVAIVSMFYNHQADELNSETAVRNAVNNTVDWLLAKGYDNVLLEISNESMNSMPHAILRPPNVHQLIQQAQNRSNGKLKVSVSYLSGNMPSDQVFAAADYITIHGNRMETTTDFRNYTNSVKQKAGNKPVVYNEDTHPEYFDDAIALGVSWGYHIGDPYRQNNYSGGYQAPPVRWAINDSIKRSFFDDVAKYTNSSVTPPTNSGSFIEQNGQVIMEVESAPAVLNWKLETDRSGYSGAGYYTWRGPSAKNSPGTAILSYPIKISSSGTYNMSIHVRRDMEGQQRENDEVNDVYVRMDGGTWTKSSHHTAWGSWGWLRRFSLESGLVDAKYNLSAGYHTFEIAARSDLVKIDKIHLHKGTNPALGTPVSSRE